MDRKKNIQEGARDSLCKKKHNKTNLPPHHDILIGK